MVLPNITAPFKPYPWQLAPWRDKSPILLLTGSKNGGKSHLAAEKIHGYLKHYAGATATLSRKAHEFAVKSIVPMMEFVIGDDHNVQYVNGTFFYSNGSRAYITGMLDEKQRQAMRSIRGTLGEPDIAWMEEANAFTRSDFEEVDANTRGHVAGWNQIILTTNPDVPQHWIYTDLIVGRQARVYFSSIRDNPRATQADYDRLDRLTGIQRDRLRDGKWVRAEGVVYDEFDPAVHVIDPFPVPAEWRKFRAIDYGYTNPFVCQWWAVDPDGRMYLYRELVKTKALVEDLTPRIKQLSGGERFDGSVSDHDAEDRATMERHGINTMPANKEVLNGIQAVKARLKVQGDGKPRLYILRGALVERDEAYEGPQGLEEEIVSYSWQKYTDGKPNKEEPLKMYDHSCDPARYLAMHLINSAPLPKQQPKQPQKFQHAEGGWSRKY